MRITSRPKTLFKNEHAALADTSVTWPLECHLLGIRKLLVIIEHVLAANGRNRGRMSFYTKAP
jgi:hypothetical protein